MFRCIRPTLFIPLTWAAMKFLVLFLSIGTITALGCESAPPGPVVIIRPDEPLAPEDWSTFERIVKSLPGEKLPAFGPLFAPPPQWKDQRTISISDLLKEETGLLAKKWNPTELGAQWNRSTALQRALRIEQVTPEQFAAWTQALALAAMRNVASPRNLSDHLRKEALLSLRKLETDERMFSTLTPEERYRILRDARALARVHRHEWLMKAPEENQQLAKQHEAWLKKVLPGHVWADPILEVTDHELSLGVPFGEHKTDGDALLRYNSLEGDIFYTRPNDPSAQ